MSKKPTNERNAGRPQSRSWKPVIIGPFEVHPDVKKDFEYIRSKTGETKVGQFRECVKIAKEFFGVAANSPLLTGVLDELVDAPKVLKQQTTDDSKTPEQLKLETLNCLNEAYNNLCKAQDAIASVQGVGMSDIYTDIGNCYSGTVLKIIGKLCHIKPTGISKIT